MSGSRRIYVIENEASVAPLLNGNEYRAGHDVVVCMHYLPYLRLRRISGNHQYLFSEELLDAADYKAIHLAADNAAFQWYRCKSKDFTLFQGLSYGELVKITFSRRYMTPVLIKHGEIIRKALSRWRDCKEVRFDFSGLGFNCIAWTDAGAAVFDKVALAESVCRQLAVPFSYLPPPIPLQSAVLVAANVSAGRIRNKARRLIHALANTWAHVRGSGTGPKIYLGLCFNNLSLLDHADRNAILNSLPRALLNRPARLLTGWPVIDFEPRATTQTPDVREFLIRLKNHIEEMSSRPQALDFFKLNGISYAECHLAAICDLALHIIPDLVARAETTAKVLGAHNIHTFLTVDSLSEQAQTEIAICKREGVRTVFVDHGVDAFRPAMHSADRALTDVAINPGTFDRGDRGTTTFALGNPCFDWLANAPKNNPEKIKSLLFLGFEDAMCERLDRCAWQEKYYEEAFSTFQKLSTLGIRVLYRPHPANNKAYHEYLFNFFNVPPGSFEWALKQNFAQMLHEVDLVVSSMSTCLYQSLAAGVPAVFFDPVYVEDAFVPPFNGKNFEEIIRISSGDALVELVESQLRNPSCLQTFVRNFQARHAPAYLGPLDGLSGKRIYDYVSTR